MQGPVARPLPLESELMPDGRSACAKVGSETVPPREPFKDQLPARRRPDLGSARSADAQRRVGRLAHAAKSVVLDPRHSAGRPDRWSSNRGGDRVTQHIQLVTLGIGNLKAQCLSKVSIRLMSLVVEWKAIRHLLVRKPSPTGLSRQLQLCSE